MDGLSWSCVVVSVQDSWTVVPNGRIDTAEGDEMTPLDMLIEAVKRAADYPRRKDLMVMSSELLDDLRKEAHDDRA
jgi:hypothetical protein